MWALFDHSRSSGCGRVGRIDSRGHILEALHYELPIDKFGFSFLPYLRHAVRGSGALRLGEGGLLNDGLKIRVVVVLRGEVSVLGLNDIRNGVLRAVKTERIRR